ncbi:MAG: hypothetical protein V4596_03395 [Bdellovibrionota bacterium]
MKQFLIIFIFSSGVFAQERNIYNSKLIVTVPEGASSLSSAVLPSGNTTFTEPRLHINGEKYLIYIPQSKGNNFDQVCRYLGKTAAVNFYDAADVALTSKKQYRSSFEIGAEIVINCRRVYGEYGVFLGYEDGTDHNCSEETMAHLDRNGVAKLERARTDMVGDSYTATNGAIKNYLSAIICK